MSDRLQPILVWATLAALVIVLCTGILLSWYYVPLAQQGVQHGSASAAAASVRSIEVDVVGGHVVRALHHHATSVLVASALLWLLLMLWQWRGDRRLWWSVLGLVVIALVGAWTGRLLPDDAYAATSREVMRYGLREAHGGGVVATLLGLRTLPAAALANTYALHSIMLLLASITAYAAIRRYVEPVTLKTAGIVVGAGMLSVLLAATQHLAVPGSPADIAPAKPWWMFLPLHYGTELLGAELMSIILGMMLAALLTLPWWTDRVRPITRAVVSAAIVLLYIGLLFDAVW
ncbi:MAG: hypothetical protein FGM24_04115 [Candidatus Kapabacteria bacterium]|nr:hypothetical protein [Candidatus Kapabacteria bacterium]